MKTEHCGYSIDAYQVEGEPGSYYCITRLSDGKDVREGYCSGCNLLDTLASAKIDIDYELGRPVPWSDDGYEIKRRI